MIIIFGDDHVRQEEPFFTAKKMFFEWVVEQPWNNEENVMFHLGDLFHRNLPTPKEYGLVNSFIERLRFNTIHMIPGNGMHEFSRAKKSYAIDALQHFDKVEIHYKPTILEIGSVSLLILPWIPSNFYDDFSNMKEYYEGTLVEEYKDWEFDYIFGHFDMGMFEDGIKIDGLKGKKRMGHIHIPDSQYVGSNTITRKDEKGTDLFLNSIDTQTGEEEKLPIPQFLDYESVMYPEMPEATQFVRFYDVLKAPSEDVVRERYKDYYLHTIQVDESEKDESSASASSSALTVEEHLENFLNEKQIDTKLSNKLRELIRGAA